MSVRHNQESNLKRLTYDNLNSLKTSVLTESVTNSLANTKATGNLNTQPGINFLHYKDENMEIQPISEIFEEENKENKENKEHSAFSQSSLHEHRALGGYKSSGQFAQLSQSPKNYADIFKKVSSDDSHLVSSHKSSYDQNFSIKMSETESRRLENLKDSSTTERLQSTNISIDPNSYDEEVKMINFLPKIKGNQCGCKLSSVSTLKC